MRLVCQKETIILTPPVIELATLAVLKTRDFEMFFNALKELSSCFSTNLKEIDVRFSPKKTY